MTNRNEQLAARRAYEVTGFELHTSRPEIGLEIWWRTTDKGWIETKYFEGKAGKPKWFYAINPARAAEFEPLIERTVAARERSLGFKAEQKAKANAAPAVEIREGDVFKSSWGYDQTNIDYYQVTRVISPKTIEVRAIGAISWGEGEYMQGRSVPALDSFAGPAKRKRVRTYDGANPSISINSFSNAYLMTPVIEGVPAYASSHWTSYA